MRPALATAVSSSVAERRKTFQATLSADSSSASTSPDISGPSPRPENSRAGGISDRKSIGGGVRFFDDPVEIAGTADSGRQAAQKGKFVTRSSVFGNNPMISAGILPASADVGGTRAGEFGTEFTRLPDRRRMFEASD